LSHLRRGCPDVRLQHQGGNDLVQRQQLGRDRDGHPAVEVRLVPEALDSGDSGHRPGSEARVVKYAILLGAILLVGIASNVHRSPNPPAPPAGSLPVRKVSPPARIDGAGVTKSETV